MSTAKPFSLEDESPLAYFSKLTEFIYNPIYARYLRRLGQRYERDKLPEDFGLMPFIVDALIFETYIDGKSVLDLFIQTYREQMTREQLEVYKGFKNYLFGCFRILSHEGRDGVLLQDLLDEQTVLLRDADARRFLFPKLYTVARLLPFADHYVPTGACALVNLPDDQQVLAFARLLRQPPLLLSSDTESV